MLFLLFCATVSVSQLLYFLATFLFVFFHLFWLFYKKLQNLCTYFLRVKVNSVFLSIHTAFLQRVQMFLYDVKFTSQVAHSMGSKVAFMLKNNLSYNHSDLTQYFSEEEMHITHHFSAQRFNGLFFVEKMYSCFGQTSKITLCTTWFHSVRYYSCCNQWISAHSTSNFSC